MSPIMKARSALGYDTVGWGQYDARANESRTNVCREVVSSISPDLGAT